MTYNYEHRQNYNPFDLFLLADTSTSFSSDVVGAARTADDTYFSDCSLNLWDIKYNFKDNDIFYMRDEYFNEAPFDFKHKRFQPVESGPKYYWLSYHDTDDIVKDLSILPGAKAYNNRLDATCDISDPLIFLVNSSAGVIMNTQIGNRAWDIMFSGTNTITDVHISNAAAIYVLGATSATPNIRM